MRFKFTLTLVVLNICAFGFLAYLNTQAWRTNPSPNSLSIEIGHELLDADRIELEGKEIVVPCVLVREGSKWYLTEPMRWIANYYAINKILNQLLFLEQEASFLVDEIEKSGQSLADYGLNNPSIKLTIAEGDKSISISIGTPTNIGEKVYLLGPQEREVFVVNRQAINGLLIDLNDLYAREIFNIPVFEVDELSLQIRSESALNDGFLKVRLARINEVWNFETPVAAKANPHLVNNTINELTNIKVSRFLKEDIDSKLLGFESPSMRVTIYGNKRNQTLIIGNLDTQSEGASEYFAKLENNSAVFTVLAKPFDVLRQAQRELRERNFFNFNPSNISGINISDKGRKIRIQKLEIGDKYWQILESKEEGEIRPYRADPIIIERLLNNLSNLRASNFALDDPTIAEDTTLGFNIPRRTVQLNLTNAESLTLTLAHPESDNESLYAKTNQANFIYEVDRILTLRMVPLNTLFYRNRVLEKLPTAARISELELRNLQTGQTVFKHQLPNEKNNWNDYLEESDLDHAIEIQSLVNYIRLFTVKNYSINEFGGTFKDEKGQEQPWLLHLLATVELPGDEIDRVEKRKYVFSKRFSGSKQFGGSEEKDIVFEITQELLEALHQLTENIVLPPEATDRPVPNPIQVEPVPKPGPMIQLGI